MSFNFQWIPVDSGPPRVTIASYGIIFSAAAIAVLSKPPYIMIGVDRDAGIIGIKGCEANDQSAYCFEFAERERNGSIKIAKRDFIRYLSSVTGVDFMENTVQFEGTYDEEQKILILNLNEASD